MTLRIFIILVIFTLFLCSMIGVKQWTLNSGAPVLLETQPIDPRSLFRGDYVRLNYKISNLQPSELEGDDQFKKHDKIYVALTQKEKYWDATGIYHKKPLNHDVVLQGKVKYVLHQNWNQDSQKMEEITSLNVKYGIENYFVPEGEGLDLERRDNNQVVDIRVAIDRFGKAGIKEILVNNKIRYTESLF